MPRTVPVAASVVPGAFETAALWNAQVKALNDFLSAPPVFSGYATTTQSIPNGNAMTALNFDTEILDSDGGHSTVTNTSRYTATVPGLYLVFGFVGWANTSGGDRRIQIALNGASVIGSAVSMDPGQPVIHGLASSAFVTMNGATDYVEVQAGHTAAANLLTSTGSFAPAMRVVWISR
ncbi:hypothetical protein ACFXKI_09515 [Streptomyces mirabilis]|uniref:hypothetical protein n=1 Tax=Streptomyces mirabilis TaxID=68239 RepID=UPI0036D0CC7B